MTTKPKQEDAKARLAEVDALFNSIGDGALATDEFGKIIRMNPAALAILGYKSKEVLNHWFPSTVVAVDEANEPVPLIDRPITRAFLSGHPITEKTYYRRRNGSRIPVSVTVSPLISNNRPVGAVEVFRDITVEYEIDRMKSEFISLASHQLRTPLSAVKTYAHMLLDGYMGELTLPQRKSLTTIVAASNRMNELISTLLNITRIENGSISLAPKPTNLHKLTDEVIKELIHSANAKNIGLEIKSRGNSLILKTDALLVKEIITNLMTNAIKYSPENSKVLVRLQRRPTSVTISVADSGFGIPLHAQPHIFTKFYRAQNVVRRETSGTGLGLYLVKGLTEQLGGKIWFSSEEDKGTTFYLTLPKHTITKAALPATLQSGIKMV